MFLDHLKTGPFENRTKVYHSKTGHVPFSDPHCTTPNVFTNIKIRLNSSHPLVHFQLALSQGAGGAHSAAFGAWLGDALVQWFAENRDLDSYEVSEFLETVLNRDLDLIVQDGSTDEVGNLLVQFFGFCSTKTEAEIIDKVRSLPKCDLSRCR